MSIKVDFVVSEKQFPIFIKINGDKFKLTEEAAIELKDKLQNAIDSLIIYQAMTGN